MTVLRPLQPSDGDAFAALLARSADSGAFQVSSRFRIDPWKALGALHGDFEGVVAEDEGGLAGCGLARYFRGRFEGVERNIALLNTLVVDPAHRRQGLAGKLAEWRIARARERIGADGVIYAGIQQGNVGSVKTAARWANQTLSNVIGLFPMPPRRTKPNLKGFRALAPGDEGGFAQGVEAHFANDQFFPGESAERLRAWLAETPVETPFRFAYVIEEGGELLAGLAVTEGALIRTMRMVRMPGLIRLLNLFIPIVPRDGHIREASVSRFWWRPGHEDAAKRLWEALRWEWRQRASTFMLWTDPRAPLAGLMKPLPFMPKSTGSLVVAAPVSADPERLVYPMM